MPSKTNILLIFVCISTLALRITAASASDEGVLFLAGATNSVSVVTPACSRSKPQPATLIVHTRLGKLAADKRLVPNLLKFGVKNITDSAPQLLAPCRGYAACGYSHCDVDTNFEVHHRHNVVARGTARATRDGSLIPSVSVRSFDIVGQPGPNDQFADILQDQPRLNELSESTNGEIKAEALFLLGMSAERGSKLARQFWEAASKLGHRGATLNLFWFSPTSETLSGVKHALANGNSIRGGIFDGKPGQKELFERGVRLGVGPYVAFTMGLSQRNVELSGDNIVPLKGRSPTKDEINQIVRRYYGNTISRRAAAARSLGTILPVSSHVRCDQFWCYIKTGPSEIRYSLFLTADPECTAAADGSFSCKILTLPRVRISVGDSDTPGAILGGPGRADRVAADVAAEAVNGKIKSPLLLVGSFERDGSAWTTKGPIILHVPSGEKVELSGD